MFLQWFAKRSRTEVEDHVKRSVQTLQWQDAIWVVVCSDGLDKSVQFRTIYWNLRIWKIHIITKKIYPQTLCVCHLNYEFANIIASVCVCLLMIQDLEHNATDWVLKWCNQCSISYHAWAIMQTSKKIHLLMPQLGISTNRTENTEWERALQSAGNGHFWQPLCDCSLWKPCAQMRWLAWERKAEEGAEKTSKMEESGNETGERGVV